MKIPGLDYITDAHTRAALKFMAGKLSRQESATSLVVKNQTTAVSDVVVYNQLNTPPVPTSDSTLAIWIYPGTPWQIGVALKNSAGAYEWPEFARPSA